MMASKLMSKMLDAKLEDAKVDVDAMAWNAKVDLMELPSWWHGMDAKVDVMKMAKLISRKWQSWLHDEMADDDVRSMADFRFSNPSWQMVLHDQVWWVELRLHFHQCWKIRNIFLTIDDGVWVDVDEVGGITWHENTCIHGRWIDAQIRCRLHNMKWCHKLSSACYHRSWKFAIS